jgi:hypothetical protein
MGIWENFAIRNNSGQIQTKCAAFLHIFTKSLVSHIVIRYNVYLQSLSQRAQEIHQKGIKS